MNQSNVKGKPAGPVPGAPAGGSGVVTEQPCPECGEMVRKGLVRCWNCGAFMDAALRARYQEMRSNPAPPIYSQVPDEEMVSVDPAPEDDFQLAAALPGGQRADLRGLESAAAESKVEDTQPEAAPAISHSVATAGDVLLAAAMQEQAETRQRRRKRSALIGGTRTPGGFIIFCPYGCRIEVKDQHRGMQGRCPRCRAPFLVPFDPPDYTAAKKPATEEAAGGEAADAAAGGRQWLDDLHVHTVPPEKFKLKADSLLKDFVEQDFAFAPDGFLRVSLAKKGGLFGGSAEKKKAELRDTVRLHLLEGKPLSSLPAGEHQAYPTEKLQELYVVQPAASRAQSLFHGIPVFGTGRIAVQLPLEEDGIPRYVSLGITQFRRLAAVLSQLYGIEDFGAGCGIPATDEFEDAGKCHYLGTPVRSLKHLEFYRADPTVQLELAGWKCASCGLTISEDARKKEKFGGKDGKAIAKAKCPKCAKKFGHKPLYTIKTAETAATAAAAPEAEPAMA